MFHRQRKVLIEIAKKAALALVLLDLAIYLAAIRPLDNLVASEWQRFNIVRRRVDRIEAGVVQLQNTQAALPETENKLKVFVRKHVPSRRQAFSRAARSVRRLTDQSGVQLAGLNYHLDSSGGETFERLGVEVTVDRPFNNVLKFTHAIETASDFVLVREFSVASTGGDALEMRLMADWYLSR